MHYPLCQRHCHQGDIPFSVLTVHCLSSGGPTCSELFCKALPANQVILQAVPPWNCQHQGRSTSLLQLQYLPEVLMHSDPLATHNKIDIWSATNFLPASASRALGSLGHHCLECTCWAVHSRGHCTAVALVPFSCSHSLPRAFLSLLDLQEGRSSHRRAGSAQQGLCSFPERFLTRSVCDWAWAGIPADILTSATVNNSLTCTLPEFWHFCLCTVFLIFLKVFSILCVSCKEEYGILVKLPDPWWSLETPDWFDNSMRKNNHILYLTRDR